jgi:uncharacterized repeat protein (TIGR04138 family)
MAESVHPLAELLRRDERYTFDAYVFVFEALRYAQQRRGDDEAVADKSDSSATARSAASGDEEQEERHVTGQELCAAIREYAVRQYGLMAKSVLNHWGIRSTGDFGEIVFNLIDIGQMRKTDADRREDFDDVFDFEDGLRNAFEVMTSDAPEER